MNQLNLVLTFKYYIMSGFLSFANSVIRNNRRKRIKKLERVEPYIGIKSSKAEYNTASELMLNKIKRRVLKEEKKSKRKTILIFIITGIVLLSVMYYFLFVHQYPTEVPLIFQLD